MELLRLESLREQAQDQTGIVHSHLRGCRAVKVLNLDSQYLGVAKLIKLDMPYETGVVRMERGPP